MVVRERDTVDTGKDSKKRRAAIAADNDSFKSLFRDALRKIEDQIMSEDLKIFFTTTGVEPSPRGQMYSVRNDDSPIIARITEVSILFLAFIYRNPDYDGNQELYDTFVRDVYGFNDRQLEVAHRIARKFSLIQTLYQSSVFNQALAAYLLEHYWNPDVYPESELPANKREIQNNIAMYLSDIDLMEEDDIKAIMDRYETNGDADHEDGYALPHIEGVEQMQVATELSERVEKVSNFITKLRELFAPQPEMDDVDSFMDGIILD